MRINLATLAAAAGLALVAATISHPAQAEWSDQLTSHMWASKTEKRQGSHGTAIPGRPAGGWFEHRFGSTGGEAKPQTVSEYATTHRHGTVSPGVAASMRSQVIVYTPRLQIQVPLKR